MKDELLNVDPDSCKQFGRKFSFSLKRLFVTLKAFFSLPAEFHSWLIYHRELSSRKLVSAIRNLLNPIWLCVCAITNPSTRPKMCGMIKTTNKCF